MQGKLDATITLCKTCRQGGYHMVVNLFYARLEMFMALISQYLFSKDKIQYFPHDDLTQHMDLPHSKAKH